MQAERAGVRFGGIMVYMYVHVDEGIRAFQTESVYCPAYYILLIGQRSHTV